MNIEETRKKLIQDWFETYRSGLNKTNLLLINPPKEIEEYLSNKEFIIKSCWKIKNHKDEIVSLFRNEVNKKIFYNSYLEIMKEHSFLIIPDNCDFYDLEKIDTYLQKTYYQNSNFNIEEKEEYKFYLKSIEPCSFLDMEAKEIFDRVIFYNDTINEPLFKTSIFSELFKSVDLNQSSYLSEIKKDLKLFEGEKILTSRLAVFLYRVTYNIKASTTKVGRYFSIRLGLRSKTFSGYNRKSFKGYDLNVDERERLIKIEIAKRLCSLNIRKLDVEKIAMVTELPVNLIIKLNKL